MNESETYLQYQEAIKNYFKAYQDLKYWENKFKEEYTNKN